MCGIYCSLGRHDTLRPSRELEQFLQQRGPDSISEHTVTLPNNDANSVGCTVCLTVVSTVLSLRGDVTVKQPYSGPDSDSFLCWNGEAWSIGDEVKVGNDTESIFELLNCASRTSPARSRPECTQQKGESITHALARVSGPYAFVFYDSTDDLLFFGRDFLGRRSLLTSVTGENQLVICSVVDARTSTIWREVEADGIYCLDLRDDIVNTTSVRGGESFASVFRFSYTPYRFRNTDGHLGAVSVIPRLSLNKELPACNEGLDATSPAVARLQSLLVHSLSLRVLDVPQPPTVENAGHSPARVAVLFSGGLDCTVLARLTHDIYPPDQQIDLLNVAFENPRIHRNASDSEGTEYDPYELCPDRITGRKSHAELEQVCPDRKWLFVAINVPYTETMQHRDSVIQLMSPHNTEMDLSISYALYFAARGKGLVNTDDSGVVPYTTSARVMLSGLGADELFGGYQRHATAFSRRGYSGLLDELDLDIGRLGKRNLGRDDRVISHWGKEARYPYLDEQLLEWALAAPVNEKCGFGEPDSTDSSEGSRALEPGKKVLRCLAWKLGMQGVAMEKKRAIQFGARTAKMETGKTKGTQLLS